MQPEFTWLGRGELELSLGSVALHWGMGSVQQVRAEPGHQLLQNAGSVLRLGMECLLFTRKRNY